LAMKGLSANLVAPAGLLAIVGEIRLIDKGK
jgi:hypothetical protein